jgi:hypothetical protein
MRFEIEIKIPAGSRLIGTRTKGNKVIAVCEFIPPEQPEPEPRRPIGFAVYDQPAGNNKKSEMICSTAIRITTRKSMTVGVR